MDISLTDEEMELIHNALAIYLEYLESKSEHDIVIATYVESRNLRRRLVGLVGYDMSEG